MPSSMLRRRLRRHCFAFVIALFRRRLIHRRPSSSICVSARYFRFDDMLFWFDFRVDWRFGAEYLWYTQFYENYHQQSIFLTIVICFVPIQSLMSMIYQNFCDFGGSVWLHHVIFICLSSWFEGVFHKLICISISSSSSSCRMCSYSRLKAYTFHLLDSQSSFVWNKYHQQSMFLTVAFCFVVLCCICFFLLC